MGWAVIRDTVNMFFVIVLIVIAFGTILGHQRFKWQQQVPRLLITAIVINFSRTLCGLMIDFSQVIMLTFVNALKDIAGGNFVEMFGLRHMLNLNPTAIIFKDAAASSAAAGVQPGDTFIAAIIALVMMLCVLVAIIFLAIILAYRIVMLWILVTIAPLAWFFKGAEGVITTKSNPYAKWWARFSCVLQVGPVLTFFLWLSLAVAGSGNIGAEQFPSSTAPSGESGLDVGSILGIMDSARMTSFIIGLALLFAGFDAAKETCEGTSGFISDRFKQMGGLTRKIAQFPVGAAGTAAAWTGRQAMRPARYGARSVYANTVGRGLSAFRNMTANQAQKYAGKFSGSSATRRALEGYASQQKARQAAETDFAVKDKKPMSTEYMSAYLQGGIPRTEGARKEFFARLKQGLQDGDVRKALGNKGLQKVLKETIDPRTGKTALESLEDTYKGDPAFQKQMKDLKGRMPSVFGVDALKEIREAKDVQDVDKSEFESKDFRNHVSKMEYSFMDKDGTRKTLEGGMTAAILQGYLGGKIKEQWIDGGKKVGEELTPEVLASMPANLIDVTQIKPEMITPTAAANLLTNGNEAQVKALANRADLKERMKGENLKKILQEGLTRAGKDKDKRGALRGNLARLGFDLNEVFDFKDDHFVDQYAQDDFSSAVGEDKDLILRATEDPTSELAKFTASAMSTHSVSRLLRDFEDMSDDDVPKKKAFKKQLDAVFQAVESQKGVMDNQAREGELTKAQKEEHGRLKELLKQKRLFERKAKTFADRTRPPSPPAPSPSTPPTLNPEQRRQKIETLINQITTQKKVVDDSERAYMAMPREERGKATGQEAERKLEEAKQFLRRIERELQDLSGPPVV